MKRVRHAAPFLAVAGLGALMLHQVVYLVVAASGGLRLTGEHAHLSTQWAVVTPAAVLGAGVLVLRQIKTLGYQPASMPRLAAAVGVMFLVQESIEATLVGGSPQGFLLSPAAFLGLLLAPVIGWAMVAALSTVAEVVARFVATPGVAVLAGGTHLSPAPMAADNSIVLGLSPSRGPPLSFV